MNDPTASNHLLRHDVDAEVPDSRIWQYQYILKIMKMGLSHEIKIQPMLMDMQDHHGNHLDHPRLTWVQSSIGALIDKQMVLSLKRADYDSICI